MDPSDTASPLMLTPSITWMAQLGEGHIAQAFDVVVATGGIAHVRRRHMAMRPWDLDDLAPLGLTVAASADMQHGGRLVVARTEGRETVELVQMHGAGQLRVAAHSASDCEALLDRIADALREQDRPRDPRVPVWFWTMSEHGPQPLRRRLHAPSWSEISHNYVAPVREALDRIMGSPPESASGIGLWRGAPGTGKTTALRALAREWQEDVSVHVIVDPEVFLGERASYLVDVLFGDMVDEHWEDGDPDEAVAMEMFEGGFAGVPVAGMMPPGMHDVMAMGMVATGPPREARPKAKLVVLEDAGELISADARVSAGQALSRLLNLTDGMLGQGSNVSVLVTTNEPIDRLHPAIARPGRSWAHVEFRSLVPEEANAWLAEQGSDATVDGTRTLAELYGIVRGDQVVSLDTLED